DFPAGSNQIAIEVPAVCVLVVYDGKVEPENALQPLARIASKALYQDGQTHLISPKRTREQLQAEQPGCLAEPGCLLKLAARLQARYAVQFELAAGTDAEPGLGITIQDVEVGQISAADRVACDPCTTGRGADSFSEKLRQLFGRSLSRMHG